MKISFVLEGPIATEVEQNYGGETSSSNKIFSLW